MQTHPEPALSADDIALFVREGFARIDGAFDSQTAEQGGAILWRTTGCDPDDRSTWTRPVVRLDRIGHAPFREAANTTKLHEPSISLSGPVAGGLATRSAPFRSAFLLSMRPVMMDGTSMLVSDANIQTSWNGAPMCAARPEPC